MAVENSSTQAPRSVSPCSLPQEGTGSADVSTRQGVCYGIQEVLQSVTRQQLSELLPMVLPMIQTALCDDAESVRTVSAECATHVDAS